MKHNDEENMMFTQTSQTMHTSDSVLHVEQECQIFCYNLYTEILSLHVEQECQIFCYNLYTEILSHVFQ